MDFALNVLGWEFFSCLRPALLCLCKEACGYFFRCIVPAILEFCHLCSLSQPVDPEAAPGSSSPLLSSKGYLLHTHDPKPVGSLEPKQEDCLSSAFVYLLFSSFFVVHQVQQTTGARAMHFDGCWLITEKISPPQHPFRCLQHVRCNLIHLLCHRLQSHHHEVLHMISCQLATLLSQRRHASW